MRSIIFLVFFVSFYTCAVAQEISEADSAAITCRVNHRNKDFNKVWNKDWSNSWRTTDYRLPTKWYSETTSNGVTIQNSFPKGGHTPILTETSSVMTSPGCA